MFAKSKVPHKNDVYTGPILLFNITHFCVRACISIKYTGRLRRSQYIIMVLQSRYSQQIQPVLL